MSEPKNKSHREFPREWEFKRCFENCERYLDSRASDGNYVPKNPNISCPFNFMAMIDEMISRLTPKNEIEQLHGTMYVIFRNRWYSHHYPEGEKKSLPAAPKVAA
jgi:hypothetical protein